LGFLLFLKVLLPSLYILGLTWKKPSIHLVCPWGQVSSQGAVIKMTKAENVVTYLTRLTQVRDELGVVGEAIVDNELVRTTLNGVSKQWVVFVEGIVAREKLPN
jgi:hypothetical protein